MDIQPPELHQPSPTEKPTSAIGDVASPREPTPQPSPHRHFAAYLLVVAVVLGVMFGAGSWVAYRLTSRHTVPPKASVTTTRTTITAKTPRTENAQGLQLNTTKQYGNAYANGLLPVGDGKYTTTAPKAGYVYTCSQYAQNLTSSQGGAQARGPWFANSTEYDLTKKLHVNGSVMWEANFTNVVSGNIRTIVTDDLPSHPTGIFPIMASDSAYAYDRNPNSIKSQNLTYSLNANPTYGSPSCIGSEVGIMLTGVALFNAFDAGGRDAGAWEIQDGCDGHPQSDGVYHYHTLSSCIKDVSVHTVIGYALDGFPITGPDVSANNILTTADLDECHGITSQITLNGKIVTMYHYVMTEDFPYSVSCFRGTAIQPPDLAQNRGKQLPPQRP